MEYCNILDVFYLKVQRRSMIHLILISLSEVLLFLGPHIPLKDSKNILIASTCKQGGIKYLEWPSLLFINSLESNSYTNDQYSLMLLFSIPSILSSLYISSVKLGSSNLSPAKYLVYFLTAIGL